MKNLKTKKIEVIPQPQKIEYSKSNFNPDSSKVITVADIPENRFAARLLRQAIRETHGIDCEIVLTKPSAGTDNYLFISDEETSLKEMKSILAKTVLDDVQKEGYILKISKKGVVAGANDTAGIFYAVQTLIQLFEQAKRDESGIRGLEISDWPTFGFRGTYIDSDQFKGSIRVTQRNIESMIKQMSKFKLNFMIIEMYNLMPFKSFPYCADEDTLTIANWKYLIELANAYHVIIMPSLQSFAQMYDILWPCEEGIPYRESESAWPGIICPSRPEGIELLKGLYRDLLEVFKYTPYLGIGCSEVGMGWDKFCPLCQKRLDSGETLNDIYEKHIIECIDAVKSVAAELKVDVRPWMWADEFYMAYNHRGNRNFEGMENISKDIVMCHWSYWSKIWSAQHLDKYDGIKGLLERGYDVSFASASYLYNTYLLDLSPEEPSETTSDFNDITKKFHLTTDTGIVNISDQARYADQYQKEVPANKMLGGLCCTFSQHDIKCWDTTWYAYALHADYTWGDPARVLKDYKDEYTYKFAASFYRAQDVKTAETIADAYLRLDAVKNDIERNNYIIHDVIGEYDIQDNAYIGNTLEKSTGFIRELIEKPELATAGRSLADIRNRAENMIKTAYAIRKGLAELSPSVRNIYSWSYLLTAAKKIENHGLRTIYMIDQELAIKKFESSKNKSVFAGLPDRLASLRNDTRIITDEVNELTWGRGISAAPWSPSGDSTGYNLVLHSLDSFADRLALLMNE
ncbi:MAG: glycoside hydrolase family 20 zincin-like fold domain-containing protein [Saccharofermentanales bacterium]